MTVGRDIRVVVKRHPVVSYYVVTFAISWGAILILVGPSDFLRTTATSPSFALAGLASLLGPGVAGTLLTGLVDGRTGLRQLRSRLLRWRVGLRWYALALLTAAQFLEDRDDQPAYQAEQQRLALSSAVTIVGRNAGDVSDSVRRTVVVTSGPGLRRHTYGRVIACSPPG